MDKLFLEVPSIERKEDAIEYLKENVEYGSELNGTGGMDRCLEDFSYEDWLQELERRKDKEYLKRIKRCESKTFFITRKSDSKIIGMINVRYNIAKERLENGASHIGYGIRPTERRKGYAKVGLFLGLLEERKLNEKEVLLDCTVDNIGSNKVIQALGGRLYKTEVDSEDNEETNYYMINVEDAINKYSSKYRDYII